MVSRITILIPARGEESVIVDTLEALRKTVQTPHNILVVNDRVSLSDETAQVARSYANTHTNVSVVVLTRIGAQTPGFGAALRAGFARVRTPCVVVVMADLSDDAATIDRMYQKMRSRIKTHGVRVLPGVPPQEYPQGDPFLGVPLRLSPAQSSQRGGFDICSRYGWDVVGGCRYCPGGRKIGGPKLQGIFSRLLNTALFYIGFPTRDSTNAFKMYRTQAVREVPIKEESGTEASLTLLVDLYSRGARMVDIPTDWRGRKKGSPKFSILKRTIPYAKLLWKAFIISCRLLKTGLTNT